MCASRFDKPWPRKDTEETRKWIEMELEHNDIAERMIGSFSVFRPCYSVANRKPPR